MFATRAHFRVRSMPPSGLANNVTTIGPLIASFLTERPSELKQCNPCPGPHSYKLLFSWVRSLTHSNCICNGRGLCIHSLDTRPSITLRCQCKYECFNRPAAEWKDQAWKVMYVMKLVKLCVR